MRLVQAEFVLPKHQAVIEVFKGTLETTALQLLQDAIIKQMLDSGCLTIEKVVDEEYGNVYMRVEVLVEKPRTEENLYTTITRHPKPVTGKPEVDWRH